MKRFLIFALLGPLILCLFSLVFRFLIGWRDELTSGQFLGYMLLVSFGLGFPPLLAAWGVNGMARWTSWPSRLKATALTGLLAGILYPFVGASLGAGRLYPSDHGLFLLFGLLIGAIAAACSLLAHRMDEKRQ